MPQQFLQEATNTFVKGLITEAGELTFPKDASIDELNCDLERDGSRRRRLGVEFESGSVEGDITLSDVTIVSTNKWENVGNQAGVEFLVVQLGPTVVFYQMTGSTFSSEQVDTTFTSGTPYSLDLTTYARAGGTGASTAKIITASINGGLVIASSEIETLLVERDVSDGSFTVTQIDFEVRDFEWQGDTDDYFEDSASNPPGVNRQYDTANTGWVGTKGAAALSTYATSESAYPPLTLPWYSGKDSNDDFSVSEWQKIFSGNTLIVNGHFILSLFDKDRDTASGFSGVTSDTEEARFSCVASYSGRVFYSGLLNSTKNNGSKIYFSRLMIDDFKEIGKCYQINDPTSEVLPDLLDTDGGVITIPEAYNIRRLHVFGAVLYVFAENGVWAISGVDDVFRATEYSVSKISEVGLNYAGSFVSANGRPYWWSHLGIYTLGLTEQSIVAQNLSISTIQTFWDAIDGDAKDKVEAVYDGINNRVFWMYPEDEETVETKFNHFLIFDETLGAFIPWSVSDESSDSSIILGAAYYDGAGSGDVQFTVVDSDNTPVVDSSGNTVVVTRTGRTNSSSAIKLLIRTGGSNRLTFGGFTATSFLDWNVSNYSSYADAAYNFMGDLTTFKDNPYVNVYLKVTETGWQSNGAGGYDLIRPSSCKVSSYWNFKKTASGTPQQAYRLKNIPVVDENDLGNFNYPFEVVNTKLRIRGRGTSMYLRFESEEGMDFHLLGYEVIGARNNRF